MRITELLLFLPVKPRVLTEAVLTEKAQFADLQINRKKT